MDTLLRVTEALIGGGCVAFGVLSLEMALQVWDSFIQLSAVLGVIGLGMVSFGVVFLWEVWGGMGRGLTND